MAETRFGIRGVTLRGLYKVEMQTTRGSRRGVLYAYGGKLLGGNSAFGYVGAFHDLGGGEVSVELTVQRHREDPNFRPFLDIERVTLKLKGGPSGEVFRVEGHAEELPDTAFTLLMTPISEDGATPPMAVGPHPLTNGLYALDAEMFDGTRGGGNAGVLVLLDGTMRGGDGSFGYVGAYTSANGRWKGEAIVREHTPTYGNRRLFGAGHEVGIGYSGSYDDSGGAIECMAVAGKRSIRYGAVMKKLADG